MNENVHSIYIKTTVNSYSVNNNDP
jgi:hypothetical protein